MSTLRTSLQKYEVEEEENEDSVVGPAGSDPGEEFELWDDWTVGPETTQDYVSERRDSQRDLKEISRDL